MFKSHTGDNNLIYS